MHVCFYLTDSHWSGRARAFADAARALDGRGVQCTIVCAHGELAAALRACGHEVVAFRPASGVLRSAWHLSALLRSRDIDVVFVHQEREQLVAALAVRTAGRGAVIRRVPAMRAVHGSRGSWLVERLVHAGHLFAFDDDLRSAAPGRTQLEPVLAPPAIDGAAAWSGSATPASGAVATATGEPALSPAGGIAAAASALRHVPPCRIAVLAGEEPNARVYPVLRAVALVAAQHVSVTVQVTGVALDADALRIHAAALHIGDRTRVAAAADAPAAVSRVLATADVAWVVAESDDAAYGMLDAMAAGVALVAERHSISQRLLPLESAGSFAPSGGPAALAAHLLALATNAERRAELARAGRAAARRWPIGAMADGFLRAATAARDHAQRRR